MATMGAALGRAGTISMILGVAVASSCSTGPRYPAEGVIFGRPVGTTVDSELARYVLGRGSDPAPPARAEFDSQLLAVHAYADARGVDWELLRWVSSRTSPDFATLYLLERLQRRPEFARMQDLYRREVDCILADRACESAGEADRLRGLQNRYRILVVGGFHYKSDTATGADLAQPRRALRQSGYDTDLIDIDEDGIVEENAALIAAAVLRQAGQKELILVSTSKGGPETAYALGEILRQRDLRRVRAWISIGGTLRGTLLADDAMRWPKRWVARLALFALGVDFKGVPSMTVAARRGRFDTLSFPRHLLMIQYLGAPLSGQVSDDVRGRYDDLRPFGPNDGLTLLADELVEGGVPIVEPGLDHFFRAPDMDVRAVALANVVMRELDLR
jgi:hypothetical protein